MFKVHNPASGVRLAECLHREIAGCGDLVVHACCSDSRKVQRGDLFVALVGSNVDGHDFVREAVARGASAVVAERPLPDYGAPVVVVADTRDAYGRICQALVGWPANDLRVVGITGTNGKSTTAALVASVLNVAGGRAGMLSTLGYTDSLTSAPAPRSTPPPALLANWLAQMAAEYCTHAVLEISSHALARGYLAGVSLDTACVTNITRAHLSEHSTLDRYRRTKARILDLLSADALVVLNADDPVSMRLVSKVHGPALTIAMRRPAELTATVVARNLCEQTFLLNAGTDTAAVRTRLLGDHHVYNCLTAAAVGLATGIDLTTIARGLEMVDDLAGRMERIDCGQEFAVFVDDARTPHAFAAALGTLREVTPGKVICVFGSDGGEDSEGRARLARTVERCADVPIISTTRPHDEPPPWIAAELLDGFESTDCASVILDRRAAIDHAFAEAQPGDTVLIAGRGLPPDDQAIVRELLQSHVPSLHLFRSAA